MSHVPSDSDLIAFLEHLKTREDPAGPRTAKSYQSKIRQFMTWAGPRAWDPALLAAFRDHLRFEAPNHLGGQGQRPRTIKGAFTALSQFVRFLEERGYSDLPDPRKIKKPRIVKSDRGDCHVPTADETAALFAAAASWPAYSVPERFERARNQAILTLAIDLGLRRGEILALNQEHVRTQSDPWQVIVHKGKGQAHRTVPCNARARQLLGAYLEAWKAWCQEIPARAENVALLPRDRTRRLNAASVDRIRHNLIEAAGLKGKRIRLHDGRSYRITAWFGVNGVNPATIAELAGHADVGTTLAYAVPVASEKLKAVQGSEGGRMPERERLPRRLARGKPRRVGVR